MEDKLARFISFALHPVLMPFYLLVFLLSSNYYELVSTPLALKLSLAGITFLTTVILPLSFIWLLAKLGFITSIYLENREERSFPLITMAIFYYATWYIINPVPVSPIFNLFILGASLVAGASTLFNLFIKISLHMAGLGSIAGLFTGLGLHHGLIQLPLVIILILTCGIAGYARMRLHAHPPFEIYTGFLLGFLLMGGLVFMV
jgi:hypothetical protein